jgi:hypothetical protein
LIVLFLSPGCRRVFLMRFVVISQMATIAHCLEVRFIAALFACACEAIADAASRV